MKKSVLLPFLFLCSNLLSQNFVRSELPTLLNTPWEITYGPDNYLWVTEADGIVSRIDPGNGNKVVVYTAPDYYPGSPLEQLQNCFQPNIGKGTLGLALHPDFLNTSTPFIYFVYSYNNGTPVNPSTKFKVVRLTWDAQNSTVLSAMDLILDMPNGYDHLGGRLMAINRNGIDYLFMTCGDNGISELNSPTCYVPQSTNPNNNAQDPNFKNGKIHRFNIDGTIPADNPIPGNSFYTRGHRNPQGLMYNPSEDLLYDIEHGDRTDDEINILEAGMNYGWKFVRGYHGDNNIPGEASFIANYVPHPSIANDQLKEAMYSWCATTQDTSSDFLNWCTVAPSDGIYYGSSGIPEWTNSLLVVTLKDGLVTDEQVFRFKLNPDGLTLAPPTPNDPNPEMFFAADQALNGRLRDITYSPDGKTLYLINNGGGTPDKITMYNYVPTGLHDENTITKVSFYPNPTGNTVSIPLTETIESAYVSDVTGKITPLIILPARKLDLSQFSNGLYTVHLTSISGKQYSGRFVKALD